MADHMTAEQLRNALLKLAEVASLMDPADNADAKRADHLDSELRRIAARLSGMAAVPEGWKLIPLLPTDKMLDAAQTNETGGLITREARARIFRAMALAAPEPPHV